MKKDVYEKTKYTNIYKNKNDGTYAVDLSLGYSPSGKRIRTTKTGILTERQARNILNDIVRKKEMKMEITDRYLFQDLLDEYYDYLQYGKKVKPSTISTKKSKMNTRILPFFKNMKIVSIKATDIQKYHKYLDSIRKDNDEPLDSETKHNIHKILSAYFNWLIEQKEILIQNPCRGVLNFSIAKKDLKYYELDDLNKLITFIDEDDNEKELRTKFLVKAIIKTLFFKGFRLGELLGLKFIDIKYDIINKNTIDQDEIEIQVNQTVSYGKGGYTITNGKTQKSLRKLFIGKNSLKPIFDYVKYIQSTGIVFEPNDFIFTNPTNNNIITPTTIRRQINYYMDKANLPRLKLKDFRHSYATFLLSNGYRLEDIKEELGHTNIHTTEKHYATLYEQNKRNLARDIDKSA